MPIFTIWGKAVNKTEFERFCEINQINTLTSIDTIASLIATRWLEQNGDGIIEFRNAAGTVLVRLTQP